jgi:ubiquitin-protein ligase
MSVRERRLQSDYERLIKLVSIYRRNLTIEVARGNPPEVYILAVKGRSIASLDVFDGKTPVYRQEHRMRVEFSADYPAISPRVTMLGPVFHPHIWPQNNVVCLGPWRITESLDNLVLRLCSVLFYDPSQFNWNSLANGEAADWARRHQSMFPLDRLMKNSAETEWSETA